MMKLLMMMGAGLDHLLGGRDWFLTNRFISDINSGGDALKARGGVLRYPSAFPSYRGEYKLIHRWML